MVEKLDLAQEQLGVKGQLEALADSPVSSAAGPQQHSSFKGVQDDLRQIAMLEQQRSDGASSAGSHADSAAGAVRDLITQLVAREAALKQAQTAFDVEGSRWTAYYAARLVRSQTECNVTKGVVAPSGRGQQTQGKQQ